jgi:hypothetical protein
MADRLTHLTVPLPGQLLCIDDVPRIIEGEQGTWPDSAIVNQVYYEPGRCATVQAGVPVPKL